MSKINTAVALEEAIKKSDYDLVETLLETVDTYNGIPFVQPGDFKMLKILIKKQGASLNLSTWEGPINNQENLMNILMTLIDVIADKE